MGIFAYVRRVIWRAFEGPYKWRGLIHLAFSALIPLLIWALILPEQLVIDTARIRTILNDLIGLIPEIVAVNLPSLTTAIVFGIVLLFGLPRLFAAPYFLYKEQERKLGPVPRIRVMPSKEVDHLRRASPVATQGVQIYGVV